LVSFIDLVLGGSVEEHAAVPDVPYEPVAGWGGEEGEGEVGDESGGAGFRRRGVRQSSGVEHFAFALEEAEEGRDVELAEAAEEGALSGHAAKGAAGGRGADEVGWSGQPNEDLRQELVGDPQRGSFLGSLR
jgi:hypothetical protein